MYTSKQVVSSYQPPVDLRRGSEGRVKKKFKKIALKFNKLSMFTSKIISF